MVQAEETGGGLGVGTNRRGDGFRREESVSWAVAFAAEAAPTPEAEIAAKAAPTKDIDTVVGFERNDPAAPREIESQVQFQARAIVMSAERAIPLN